MLKYSVRYYLIVERPVYIKCLYFLSVDIDLFRSIAVFIQVQYVASTSVLVVRTVWGAGHHHSCPYLFRSVRGGSVCYDIALASTLLWRVVACVELQIVGFAPIRLKRVSF
jgi:hypothetical protein